MEADDAARNMVATLETAWGAGDGDGFASVFSEDADFTHIEGETVRGRADIAAHHRDIFGSVYRGTTMKVDAMRTTEIAPGVATIEANATVASDFGARGSHALIVIVRQADRWAIRSFHNMVPFVVG